MEHHEQAAFARAMEEAMRKALAATDEAVARAHEERDAAIAAQEEAREARRKIEARADALAEEYFARRRTELIEFSRTELLRRLARSHLEAGETPETIARWLQVPLEFVTAIEEVVMRVRAFRAEAEADAAKAAARGEPGTSARTQGARVRYENQGRGGTVWYESAEARFGLWWEYAGGDALALVEFPSKSTWEQRTGLPLEARPEVARFLGEHLVRDQTQGRGSYMVGDSVITIFAETAA